MKKTLIALATLAAAGGAFAQSSVTLSGAVAAGYESTKAAGAATRTAGIGNDTASIKVSATEDLGGGMSASAYVSAGGLRRGSAVGGEDAGIKLSGGFGSIEFKTYESGHFSGARATAGVPAYGLDSKVFSANANVDGAFYTLPKFGDLTIGVSYIDGSSLGTATAPVPGLGQGSTGTAGSQTSVGISAAYATGPVSILADYTSYGRQDVFTSDNRIRISGNVDLGVATIGYGYSTATNTADVTTREHVLGVKAPVGAITLGAVYGTKKTSNNTTDNSGYSVGGQYDLSKRTNVAAHYYSYKTLASTASNNGYRVLFGHSF